MKYIFIIFLFLLSLASVYSNNYYKWLKEYEKHEIKSPLKLLGKCISDHECEYNQYCDHNGVNPVGSCKVGAGNKESCLIDRYCQSKKCNLFKCQQRERVRDGVCYEADHEQCISEQYCSHIEGKIYKCKNRKCDGSCTKDAHCLTNNCRFFRCKRPSTGCKY